MRFFTGLRNGLIMAAIMWTVGIGGCRMIMRPHDTKPDTMPLPLPSIGEQG